MGVNGGGVRDMAGRARLDGAPERLVRAAIGLLAEQGPSAVKARTVASASGLSTMVVYSHFGGIPGADPGALPTTDSGNSVGVFPGPGDGGPDRGSLRHGIDVPSAGPREPSPLRPDVRTVHPSHVPAAVGRGPSVEWTFAGLPGSPRPCSRGVCAAGVAPAGSARRLPRSSPRSCGVSCTATSPLNWPSTSPSSTTPWRRCCCRWA